LFRLSTALALSLLAVSCSSLPGGETGSSRGMVAPILTGQDAQDKLSYARPEIARVTHVALDLVADFRAELLRLTCRPRPPPGRSCSTARDSKSRG
jgi:hypothetical protein